jgi:hypothetical protein
VTILAHSNSDNIIEDAAKHQFRSPTLHVLSGRGDPDWRRALEDRNANVEIEVPAGFLQRFGE